MQLSELTCEILRIPFHESFAHAAATRETTGSVLVRAKTTEGQQGLGEGCPRFYVTKEDLDTCLNFFNKYHTEFMALTDLSTLKQWIAQNTAVIDANPAAFCAVELALLNVMAATAGQSVDALLGLPEISGSFLYSALLGTDKPETFRPRLKQYLDMGMRDFKLKLFGKPQIDLDAIAALNSCGYKDLRVRVDANNLWHSARAAITDLQLLEFPLFGVEEALQARDFAGNRKLMDILDTAIILDESFLNAGDFAHIPDIERRWVINLRISKMGGILRSLDVAQQARALGLKLIIGAHVGETSILTRVALIVANVYRDLVIAQEGAYGTYLLQYDVVEKPLMFGAGGILEM